jgi:hypothetical protein
MTIESPEASDDIREGWCGSELSISHRDILATPNFLTPKFRN